ncbi:hypothetical protein RR48_00532 [Papilio machaon]|uniref:Uncharacterized protein n=1 Tax=Papilio machaon TaxID=76193 RepID=A0A0N0PFQ4_PAPMA|nr:hypothetical protein RR48_00532 [Papilio machaon]
MKSFTNLSQDLDDSSDDECPLFIVADEMQANNADADEVTDENPSANNSISNENNTNAKTKPEVDSDFYKCTCEDDFTENHMDILVPIVTLETVHDSPWTELE